jgi:hypothetical protein
MEITYVNKKKIAFRRSAWAGISEIHLRYFMQYGEMPNLTNTGQMS